MSSKPPKELVDLVSKLTLHGANLNIIPDSDESPWVLREFQRQLQALESRNELLLPNIRDKNKTISIFSDYGGDSSDSKYFTYSFLVCAWDQTGSFNNAMQNLRNFTGLNNPLKEISFKDFRYGPINRALEKYLTNLSNLVNGFLLTVVVEKSVISLFGENKKSTHLLLSKKLMEENYGVWKPEIAEKILRITHFLAYLVALLSKKGQKVIWMTDHDSIAPSQEQFMYVLKLFSNSVKKYCTHELSSIGGALPFKEKNAMFLDLLSAPDVVAGSIEHYFSRSHGESEEPKIKEGANHVLRWLSGQGISLKKHVMFIRPQGDGIVSGTLKFELKEKDPEAIFIPVIVK